MYCMEENRLHPATATESATVIRVDARPRSGREGSPNRSRDRKGALMALPIALTLPYGRGSDWSTPYARILSIGRHLCKALVVSEMCVDEKTAIGCFPPLWAAYCLHFGYYNFCRIHKTLRVTPCDGSEPD